MYASTKEIQALKVLDSEDRLTYVNMHRNATRSLLRARKKGTQNIVFQVQVFELAFIIERNIID